jgi:hypothetical protein
MFFIFHFYNLIFFHFIFLNFHSPMSKPQGQHAEGEHAKQTDQLQKHRVGLVLEELLLHGRVFEDQEIGFCNATWDESINGHNANIL